MTSLKVPVEYQPQTVTMLAGNVLEGDKQVDPVMSSAEGDPVMIRTTCGARFGADKISL